MFIYEDPILILGEEYFKMNKKELRTGLARSFQARVNKLYQENPKIVTTLNNSYHAGKNGALMRIGIQGNRLFSLERVAQKVDNILTPMNSETWYQKRLLEQEGNPWIWDQNDYQIVLNLCDRQKGTLKFGVRRDFYNALDTFSGSRKRIDKIVHYLLEHLLEQEGSFSKAIRQEFPEQKEFSEFWTNLVYAQLELICARCYDNMGLETAEEICELDLTTDAEIAGIRREKGTYTQIVVRTHLEHIYKKEDLPDASSILFFRN